MFVRMMRIEYLYSYIYVFFLFYTAELRNSYEKVIKVFFVLDIYRYIPLIHSYNLCLIPQLHIRRTIPYYGYYFITQSTATVYIYIYSIVYCTVYTICIWEDYILYEIIGKDLLIENLA